MYSKLIIQGSVEQKAEIIRIVKDVQKMAESRGYNLEDCLGMLLVEEVEKNEVL